MNRLTLRLQLTEQTSELMKVSSEKDIAELKAYKLQDLLKVLKNEVSVACYLQRFVAS